MSTISKRIKQYLALNGDSQAEFAKNVNRSEGWVNNMGNSLKHEQLSLIKKHYSDLNINWLLTGVGEMIINKTQSQTKAPPDKEYNKQEKLPIEPKDDLEPKAT